MALTWTVEPFDGVSAPLSLRAESGNSSQSIPVTEADLEALAVLLAERAQEVS